MGIGQPWCWQACPAVQETQEITTINVKGTNLSCTGAGEKLFHASGRKPGGTSEPIQIGSCQKEERTSPERMQPGYQQGDRSVVYGLCVDHSGSWDPLPWGSMMDTSRGEVFGLDLLLSQSIHGTRGGDPLDSLSPTFLSFKDLWAARSTWSVWEAYSAPAAL